MPSFPLAAAPGFDPGDVFALGVLFVGLAVVAAVVALSHHRERAFSASTVYLGLGVTAAAAIQVLGIGWLDPVDDAGLLEHLTEAALVIALFGTGLKLDRPLRWREWSSVARLLGIAMPLTIGAIALFAHGVMGLSLAAAVLLGAALAPTDPVLAGDIGVGPPGEEDRHEPNFALTAEAASNDGLAFPFVILGLFLAEEAGTGWLGTWLLADVGWAVAAALVAGAAIGRAAAWSVQRLRDRELLTSALDGYHAISTALVTYGAVQAIDGYGFLAVFVAGIAFRRYERGHELNARLHTSSELLEKMLELAVILTLGSLLTRSGLTAPGWAGWFLAALLIVAIRPVSCAVALLGSKVEGAPERAFVGWFGVRGVGDLYYASVIAGSGALAAGEERVVVWTIIACILASVTVHGITSGPALRRLGRRQAAQEANQSRRQATARAARDVRPRPARSPATPPAR